MIRKMSIAILAAAALAGCATGYGYRGGSGDYYYGRGGGYDYYDHGSYYGYGGYGHGYGAPYRYYGGGYGYPYAYYDYPYYGYPYYYTRPPRHDDDRPDHVDRSQRRYPYPGLPDKSGVDRGPLTVGPPAGIGDAGRSRIRDLREPRPARQAAQPMPTVHPSPGRPMRALPPRPPAAARRAPVSRQVPLGSEAPRRSAPAPVRIEAPRRSAPVRSESPRREGSSRLRESERRAVPL